jgi:hypothetical protein
VLFSTTTSSAGLKEAIISSSVRIISIVILEKKIFTFICQFW